MLITLNSELELIWILRVKIEEGFYVTVFWVIYGYINNNMKSTITNIANRILPFNRIIYSVIVSLKFIESNT